MEEKFSLTFWIMVFSITKCIGRDMQVMEPCLTISNQHKRITKISLTSPQRFHLRADQNHTCLEALLDMVFMKGTFICTYQFLTHTIRITDQARKRKGGRSFLWCYSPTLQQTHRTPYDSDRHHRQPPLALLPSPQICFHYHTTNNTNFETHPYSYHSPLPSYSIYLRVTVSHVYYKMVTRIVQHGVMGTSDSLCG